MVQPTYTGPAHPIGYVELQASWVGDLSLEKAQEMYKLLQEQAAREYPGLVMHGRSRLEETVDGAGVPHSTFYMGFAPAVPSSEPLDPHNLGDAPLPQSGWPEPTDGIMPLGTREQKF
jgi:hypothetical protein